jgi:predicted DNA-binding antitoxin AbrB/MazE fold protein
MLQFNESEDENMNAVRAIYEHGHLRLLEPLDLVEGQQVEVVVHIPNEDDLFHMALADLVDQWPDANAAVGEIIDEEALQQEVDEATRGIPPISEAIIEERREGR